MSERGSAKACELAEDSMKVRVFATYGVGDDRPEAFRGGYLVGGPRPAQFVDQVLLDSLLPPRKAAQPNRRHRRRNITARKKPV